MGPKMDGKGVDPDITKAAASYIKEAGAAADKFIKSAPASRSASPTPDGDHSEYEQVKTAFIKNANDGKDKLLEAMDKVEYGSPQTRAKQNLIEAKAKQESMEKGRSQNMKVELDGRILKPDEYTVEVQGPKTIVKITRSKSNE